MAEKFRVSKAFLARIEEVRESFKAALDDLVDAEAAEPTQQPRKGRSDMSIADDTTTTLPFWVNQTTTGTAMSETALCDECQHGCTGNMLGFVIGQARASSDWNGRTARLRVTDNDGLECAGCGRRSVSA